MLDIIIREETLLNVIKSVTRNGKSILLTTILALILVYLFSVVGFLFLRGQFNITLSHTFTIPLLYVRCFCQIRDTCIKIGNNLSC